MFRHNASGVTWSCLIFSLHRVLVAAFHRACLAHIEAMEGVQDDMEVDDGCTLYSRDLGDAVSDGTESNESADDSTYVTCPKEGPRDFAELHARPALLVDQMKSAEEDGGEENIAFATSMLGCGFSLESDFAGAGGGEMGITSVINEFADQYGVERRANIYRSGDIGELQRKTLMHPGWEGPSHVTGDITHCVPLDGRHELNKLHTRAEAAFEEERSTCSGKDAAQRVGCSFMAAVLSCLATVTFLDAQWFFRHKRRCTLHAPASMGTRCMIAETVCKPFSAMSKTKKASAVTRQLQPWFGPTMCCCHCQSLHCTNAFRCSMCSGTNRSSTSSIAWRLWCGAFHSKRTQCADGAGTLFGQGGT